MKKFKRTAELHLSKGGDAFTRSLRISILLCAVAFSLLFAGPAQSAAPQKEIDYEELQEDPLENALKKLASQGNMEWDKNEMISGGAPSALVKDMIWPLKKGYVSRGVKKGHTGVDMVASAGTDIHAVLDGVVEIVSGGGSGFRGYGKTVIVNHSGKIWSLYSHCSKIFVRMGQPVHRGDIIAAVGSTGRTTTAHCHFEIRNGRGAPLNPMKYLPKAGSLPWTYVKH